jgi:hypothetical protein
MANPHGNLAGFTDPEDPNWRENALARVRARQREREQRNGGRKNGMYLFFDDPFRVLLDEACARRDISLTGYGRRATAAFIAHDLGLPLSAVTRHAAAPAPYMRTPGGLMRRTSDDGTGFGLWVIGELDG